MSIINKKITNVPIAQFETNIAAPLASLTLPLSPVQSFNGYDGPWPGGAGKNKLRITTDTITKSGITLTVNSDGTMIIDGTATGYVFFNLNYTADTIMIPSGNFILSGNAEAVTFRIYADGNRILNHQNTNEVAFTIPTGIESSYARIDISDGSSFNRVEFMPMIRLSSEASDTWEPYENICPISGWTGANVTRAGKNLLIEGYTYGNIDNSGEDRGTSQNYIRTVNYTPIRPSTTYYVHVNYTPQNYTQLYRLEYDANKTLLNRIQLINGNTQTEFVRSFTTTDKTAYIRFFYYSGTTFTTYENLKIWLTLDEVTDYEPSAATVYPVTWSEAGTVYSGEVDIVSGELTVTHRMANMGDISWNYISSSDIFYANVTTKKAGLKNVISSLYATSDSTGAAANIGEGEIRGMATVSQIAFRDSRFPKQSGVIAELDGVQMLYELATPQTYQLTPTQVLTLLGVNNVWSDTGNITLEYPFRVFDILRVTINGTDITDYIAFQGLKRGRNDVESPNAGRTLDAVMHRGRVATKLRWDITCRPLTSQELSILENLIMPETVNVTIEGDPYYDTWTRRCYANNTSASYLILKPDGRQLWGGITFPIIEV